MFSVVGRGLQGLSPAPVPSEGTCRLFSVCSNVEQRGTGMVKLKNWQHPNIKNWNQTLLHLFYRYFSPSIVGFVINIGNILLFYVFVLIK